MAQYDFLCQTCKKFFSTILTLADYDQDRIICPYCGSSDVEQGRWVALRALLSSKSA